MVVGVGVLPDIDLLGTDLLADDGGVRVDTQMRTQDPDVFVAGDIASVANPLYGRRIRVEHWANALMDGQIAARSMMGHASEFDPAPFFFTDQYDVGMGCAELDDELSQAQARSSVVISKRTPSTRSGSMAMSSSLACTSTAGTKSNRCRS